MLYIAVIAIFLFSWAFIGAILFIFFNKNKPISKLKHFDDDYAMNEKYEEHRKNSTNPLKIMASLIPNTNFNKRRAEKLEMELMKADMLITVEELLVVKILSSCSITLLLFAISRDFIIAVIAFIIVWLVPRFIIGRRQKERIKLFDSQLTEGITVISNSLKAGYSFLQAVAVVSEEMQDPFSKEFKKLLKEMSLGISEEEALRGLMNRMESDDLRLVLNAILIQKDIGGNLSEILDNISETIRERQKIRNEIKTLTAQGRLSGIVVMLIPIALGGVIYLFNKEYMILLFTEPLGIGMVVMAAISEIFGFLMIRKIVNVDM